MSGWFYLIKNGDLYKIGITKNLDNRMKQLKPDFIVAKLYTLNYKKLERELHKEYKNVRIPQTEYFRLDQFQIREIKKKIRHLSYSQVNIYRLFIKSLVHLLVLFLLFLVFNYLIINDIKIVFYTSFLWVENISYIYSFISLFFKSNKYLTLVNEFKFRLSRSFFYIFFALLFRLISRYFF